MANTIKTLGYEPAIEDHPAYGERAEDPDYDVGDVVRVLGYNGVKAVRNGEDKHVGQIRYLSDDMLKKYERGEVDLVHTHRVVREVNGHFVRVSTNGLSLRDSTSEWIPDGRIVGVDRDATQQLAERRRKAEERQREIDRRKETDLDVLMEEVIKPHARKKVDEVWPGGTVDVDEISWFWNTRLRRCAGKAYWGGAVPQMAGGGRLAIGLAPGYYYQHGIDELLAVVRHELVHVWQYEHPDARGGHGPKFKQWLADMNTHRHCKHWSPNK